MRPEPDSEPNLTCPTVDTGPVAEGYPDCSRQGNDRFTCVSQTGARALATERQAG